MMGSYKGRTDVSEFDVEERWPELFADLSERDRKAVRASLVAIWHEGWEPNREDVKNLTDRARGVIDKAEYQRRAHEAALRRVSDMRG